MFATLRCTKDSFSVEDSHYSTAGTGFKPRSLACKNCREKKLRCSRQQDGCDACKANNVQCVYNKPPSERRSKRRVQSPKRFEEKGTQQPFADSRKVPHKRQRLHGASIDNSTSTVQDATSDSDAIPPMEFPMTCHHPDTLEESYPVSIEADAFLLDQGRPANSGLDADSTSINGAEQALCDPHDILRGVTDDTVLHRSHSADYVLPSLSEPYYPESRQEVIIPTPSPPLAFPEDATPGSSLERTNTEPGLPGSSNTRPSSHLEIRDYSDVDCRSSFLGRDCMGNALSIFEAVEVKKSRNSKTAVDQLLCFNKNAIRQCKLMLSCQSCTYSPGFNMLLIAIVRGLTSLLERVSHVLKESSRRWNSICVTSLDSCELRRNLGEASISEISPNSLGGYIIDSQEERDRMLCTPAALQINALALLAQKLKAKAVSWNRTAHQEMVSGMEDCFASVRLTLKQIQQSL